MILDQASNPLAGLPPMAETAKPLLMPGLLSGLGLSPRPVPTWISDPNLIASIEAGLIDIPDEFCQTTIRETR